ncbi:MAG: ATP-binding protein, partial [Bacteroidota bacterium]
DLGIVSSDQGIYFFDGIDISEISIREFRSFDLESNNVQSNFHKKSDTIIWFTTYESLCKLNLRSLDQVNYKVSGSNISKEYRIIYLDEERNKIWVVINFEIYVFDLVQEKFHQLEVETRSYSFIHSRQENNILEVLGCPWWDTTGVELLKLNLSSFEISKEYFPSNEHFSNGVNAGNGQFLVGSDLGPYQLTMTNEGVAFDKIGDATEDLRLSYYVRDLYYDDENQELYLACPLDGLYKYGLVDGTVSDYSTEFPSPYGFHLDSTYGLWVFDQSADNGLDIFGNYSKFIFTPGNSLGIDEIKSVAISEEYNEQLILDMKGKVWQLNCMTSYVDNGEPELLRTTDRRSRKIYYTSNRNAVIIGNNTLEYLDIGDKNYISIDVDYGYSHGFYEFSTDGAILLAENKIYDLFRFRDSLIVRNRPISRSDEKWDLTTLFELGESQIAIPIATTSLVVFDVEDNDLISVDTFQVGFQMFAASKASDGLIYVGTNAGIFVCGEDKTRPLLSEFFDISTFRIHSIQEANGKLWFATDEGILSYSLADGSFSLFSEADGVPSLQYLDQEALYQDGTIVFFAEEGFISFNPEEIRQERLNLQPYISDTWVNNIPNQSIDFTSPLGALDLPYTENSVRFRVRVVSPFQSEKDAIYYQLQGYEDYYTKISIGEDANYTKLDPGSYNLHIYAISRHGIREGELYIPITIRPPFWQTLWFRLAAGLAIISIIGGIYMALLRREVRKQTRLREQQSRLAAERDRIAGEVHDDLGGQLSSILFLSEGLTYEAGIPDNLKPSLNRLHDLSKSSLQNIRDIIFALDNRRSTVEELVARLEQGGTEVFADRGITFNCRKEVDELGSIELTSRQKRNLTLIVKEAFHNAVKHAEASWVQLLVQHDDGKLLIQVSDDGKGFDPPEDLANMEDQEGGYGIENMYKKATAIGADFGVSSAPGDGTTITISWPPPNQE